MGLARKLVTMLSTRYDGSGTQRGEREVKRYRTEANKGAAASDKLAGSIRGLMAKLAGTVLFGSVGRDLVDVNKEFQTLSARLQTVEGSANAAASTYDKLKGFAATTPFQENELIDGWVKLRQLGLNPTLEDLTSMGDITATQGQKFAKMMEAFTSSVRGSAQIIENFFPGAKAKGGILQIPLIDPKTNKKTIHKVKADAKSVLKFMREAGKNAMFAGGMERQARTLGGRLSTLKDTWRGFLRDVGEGGFTEAGLEFIKVLTEELGGSKGKDTARTIGQTLFGAIHLLTDAMKFAKENVGLLKIALISFAAAGALAGAMKALTMLSAVAAGVASPFAIAAAALALILLFIEDLNAFAEGEDSVFGRLAANFPQFRQAVLWAFNFVNGNIKLVETAFSNFFDWLAQRLFTIVDSIQDFIARATPIIRGWIETMVEWFSSKIDGVIDKITNMVNRVRGFFGQRGISLFGDAPSVETMVGGGVGAGPEPTLAGKILETANSAYQSTVGKIEINLGGDTGSMTPEQLKQATEEGTASGQERAWRNVRSNLVKGDV